MTRNPTFHRRREQRLQAEEFGRMQRRQAREVAEAISRAWALCSAATPAEVHAEIQATGQDVMTLVADGQRKPH